MKTLFLNSGTTSKKFISTAVVMLAIVFFNTVSAQETVAGDGITVSGVVATEDGPLEGATVALKGTNIGVTTDKNGEFTFPRRLKLNDILVFSYLSYNTKEIRIADETKFFKVELTDDVVELLGAPAVNKPYKSKRKNSGS